jgi:3-methyladenine DNA glycosylase AlkD
MKRQNSVEMQLLEKEIRARLQTMDRLTTAVLRAVRREFSRRLTKAAPEQVVGLALQLLKQPGISHRFVAYELICHHRAARRSLRARELTQLGQGIDSWAAVDCFACYLAGPAWRERQVPDSLIHAWARSPDRWWRRAALVCAVPLNNKARGGTGDTPRTLGVCRLLVADGDDMVVKALSWVLRELAKRDPAAARSFLAEHRDVLAARVVREVSNKLSTGLKNPKRR